MGALREGNSVTGCGEPGTHSQNFTFLIRPDSVVEYGGIIQKGIELAKIKSPLKFWKVSSLERGTCDVPAFDRFDSVGHTFLIELLHIIVNLRISYPDSFRSRSERHGSIAERRAIGIRI